MATVLAAMTVLTLGGQAPKNCACGLPGFTLSPDQSSCAGPAAETCVPPRNLCPSAVGSGSPCIGDTTYSSLGGQMTQRNSGSLGFMYADEPLWLSLLGSQLVHVPDFMEGLPMWTSEHSLPAQTTVRVVCPGSASVPGCRFYVFVYDCNTNCKPESDLGVLASQLLPLGYEISHCAPSFRQIPGGQVHATKAFVRHVARGEEDTFVLPATVRHMWTSVDRAAHNCPSFDQIECILPGVADCMVDPATTNCISSLCPPKPHPQGPLVPYSCGTCPSQELMMIP